MPYNDGIYKCKICKSGRSTEIEFCRLFMKMQYPEIIALFEGEEGLVNLNLYNLSNHLNKHVSEEKIKFYQKQCKSPNHAQDLEFLGKDMEKIKRAAQLFEKEQGL